MLHDVTKKEYRISVDMFHCVTKKEYKISARYDLINLLDNTVRYDLVY